MPQKSRPDPSNGTVVTADEFEGMQLGAVEDGVIGIPTDLPVVYADSTGRRVKVRADRQAVVRGYSWWSDPAVEEVIDNAGAGLPSNTSGLSRIDRLVLRLDRTARTVRAVYLQGTPGTPAVAPALTQNTSQTSGVWDFPLARWTVINGYTTISASDVTPEAWYRPPGGNTALCNSTSRPFGGYLYPGQEIYEYNTGLFRKWDGTAWRLARPYEQTIVLSSPAATVTFSNIPNNLSHLRFQFMVRSNAVGPGFATGLYTRINGNATNNYWANVVQVRHGALTGYNDDSAVWCQIGHAAMNATAYSIGTAEISGWDLGAGSTDRIHIQGRTDVLIADTDGYLAICGGMAIVAPPWTSVTFLMFSGSFAAGCKFVLHGWE